MSAPLAEEERARQLRGTGLGIAGQATQLGAWVLGVLGAISNSPIAWLGALAGVTGLVLSVIAFFLLRGRWGLLGPAASWLLIGGVASGLVAFAVIPGGGMFGKLGAFIWAMGLLALGVAVGHLIAAIGLLRSGPRPIAVAALVSQTLTLILALGSGFASLDLWLPACATAFACHLFLLLGLVAMRAPGAASVA